MLGQAPCFHLPASQHIRDSAVRGTVRVASRRDAPGLAELRPPGPGAWLSVAGRRIGTLPCADEGTQGPAPLGNS